MLLIQNDFPLFHLFKLVVLNNDVSQLADIRFEGKTVFRSWFIPDRRASASGGNV